MHRQPRAACWGACLLVGLLLAVPVRAQRVQFPSSLPPDASFPDTAPPPGAALDGTIQPLHQPWDPYAQPGPQQPLYAPDPTLGYPPGGTVYPGQAPAYGGESFFQAPMRFLQSVDFDYAWLYGQSGTELGFNELDFSATFALPIFYSPNPLLLTPGFAVSYVDGPVRSAFASMPDLPPRLYSAYLQGAWRPQLTTWLTGDLAFKTGYWGDFEFANSQSVRFLGRGSAILSMSARAHVVLGVEYLDRLKIKLLPVVGIIWTPNDETRWEAVFPHPKIAQRLIAFGNHDAWMYVRGEYGGGSWTIERIPGAPVPQDAVDYNDVRIAAGFELISIEQHRFYFEVGYVFDREVVYKDSASDFTPDDTFLIGGGLSF